MRNLGGCIGVSICANIVTATLSVRLNGVVSRAQLEMVLRSALVIDSMSPEVQEKIRGAFADSFTFQMQACTGLGAAAILGTLVMIERKPRFQS
jgi:hypothetical protein